MYCYSRWNICIFERLMAFNVVVQWVTRMYSCLKSES